MTDKEIVCRLCGRCCFLEIDGKPSKIRCKHLVKISKDKSICRIYHTRLGQNIGHGNRCIMREISKFEYPGCPFNETVKKNGRRN